MSDLVVSSSLLLSRDLTPSLRFWITLALCILACGFLFLRARLHARRRARIAIRIHVAGTRGKSSTVRYIAAGFRSAGFVTLAKTTGTEPSLILPDGTEKRIRRWGAPAIREQRDLVAEAARLGANVLVVEAMAIQPEYLDALERFYIRATDLVVTNLRPDHEEQLGSGEHAVAEAIAACIPAQGRIFASTEAASAIATQAAARGAQLLEVKAPDDRPEAQNLSLAAAVCRDHGIEIDAGSAIFAQATPDVGAFQMSMAELDGRTLRFANAFSCNDAASFRQLWQHHQPADAATAFFLSPRSDRPLRTQRFLEEIARLAPQAQLFIGSRNVMIRRLARRCGFADDHIHLVPPSLTHDKLAAIASALPDDTVLWGIGNFKGDGERMARLLQGRAA